MKTLTQLVEEEVVDTKQGVVKFYSSHFGSSGASSSYGAIGGSSSFGKPLGKLGKPDPSGPLSGLPEIKNPGFTDMQAKYCPIKVEVLPNNQIPSSLNAPASIGDMQDIMNRLDQLSGNGSASSYGAAGNDLDVWKTKEFDYRNQGKGFGSEIINIDRNYGITIKAYADIENQETRLTFEKFGGDHKKKKDILIVSWGEDE